MIYVFIHGSFSAPEDAWYPWLTEQLTAMGHEVVAPRFTVDRWEDVGKLKDSEYISRQNLQTWLAEFAKYLPQIQTGTELNFVGHSLGPLFILHLIRKYGLNIEKAYFVAPFLEVRGVSAIVEKANATFYYSDFDFEYLRKHIRKSTVIYSDDDPYVKNNLSLEFAEKLGSQMVKLHGYGHMGVESNLTEFPELLAIIKQTK